tara:strand:- start:186 stop:743 length:558 start_codon:yes stop_codon:yes gene_type:complete
MKKIYPGNLLISTPNILSDYYFKRSIVLITEINEKEVIGLIINKELDYNLSDIDSSVNQKKIKVFSGGPVKQDNLFFIHNEPKIIKNSRHCDDNLCFGGDYDKLIKMINEKVFDCKNKVKFFSGYSGWTLKQLNEEIKEGSWIIETKKNINVFNCKVKNLWKNEIKKSDPKFKIWLNAPNDPQNN